MPCGRLPDPDALFRRDVERIAGLDVERTIPGVDVAERRERPDHARRVRTGGELLTQRVVAEHRAPHLRPSEEEALVAGEAVDHRSLAATERVAIGFVGDGETAEVADILAHGDAAIDVLAGKLREVVGFILRAETRRLSLERLG